MDIIIEGSVAVQKINEDGNILTINVFTNGDLLGANLLFSSRNYYPMTVISETKSIILHIEKGLIPELGKTSADFMIGLLKEVSDRTLFLTERIDAISLKTIRDKIISYLLYEYSLQKSSTIIMDVSKKDLAERFGIQRTSLSRELQKMRNDGLIEYDRNAIVIKQLNILK